MFDHRIGYLTGLAAGLAVLVSPLAADDTPSQEPGVSAIITFDDKCWIPRPELVPTDATQGFAERLVDEDTHVSKNASLVQAEEARRLRVLWMSAPAKVRRAIPTTDAEAEIKSLSEAFPVELNTLLEQRRRRLVAEYWRVYRDAFETDYRAQYTRLMGTLRECRPVSREEESPLLKAADSTARTTAARILGTDAAAVPLDATLESRVARAYQKVSRAKVSDREYSCYGELSYIDDARFVHAWKDARRALSATRVAAGDDAYYAETLILRLSHAYALAATSSLQLPIMGCAGGAAAGSSAARVSGVQTQSGLPKLASLKRWTRHQELDGRFGFDEDQSLLERYQTIKVALNRAGLEARVYEFGERGLAVVTQLERISEDGRPAEGRQRFNLTANAGTKDWSLLDKLFRARTGKYRQFVLVISKPAEVTPGPTAPTWQDVLSIYVQGGVAPSKEFLSLSGSGLATTLLVYEFDRRDENTDPSFVSASELSARDHFVGARMWSANDVNGPLNIAKLVTSTTAGGP